jgi:hypothetical protein
MTVHAKLFWGSYGIPLLTNLPFSPNLLYTSGQEPSALIPGSRLIRSRASVADHSDILSGYRIRPNTDVRTLQLSKVGVRQLSAIQKGCSLGNAKVNIVGYGVQGKAPLDGRLDRSVYHHSTALRELQENPAWQPHRYKEGKKSSPGKLTKFKPPSASLRSSHILAAAELESLHH